MNQSTLGDGFPRMQRTAMEAQFLKSFLVVLRSHDSGRW
jgi:hypothetical protein